MDFEAAVNGKVVDAEYDAPAVAPQLSLEAVKPRFLEYKKEIARIVDEARALEIVDDQTRTLAVEIGTGAKKIARKIEVRRKEVLEDAQAFISKVNGFCKLFTGPLGDAELMLKQKLSQYSAQIELARREAERKAREEAERIQAELQRQAEETNRKAREEAMRKAEEEAAARKASEAEIEKARRQAEAEARANEIQAPAVVAPVVPEVSKTVRTETGGSSYEVKRWVCRVVDPKAVPREYCEPVKKLLDNAVQMGVREIPGCVIEEITETRFKSR